MIRHHDPLRRPLRRLLAVPALVAAVLGCGLGAAYALDPPTDAARDPGARYEACLAETRSAPQQAFETALQWIGDGGGAPARHCQAVALVALKQYGEAAVRLQELTQRSDAGPPAMRAELLDQAGNAWILANEPANAVAALDAAIKLAPDNPELLIDRARARAMTAAWKNVVADLSAALSLDPEREEAYVFRASAYRQWGNPKRALEDVETALALNDKDPDALLERGAIKLALGDRDAARQDWVRTSELAPTSPAGQAARRNLERLDLPGGDAPPRS